MKMKPTLAVLIAMVVIAGFFALPTQLLADDLDRLKLPVVRSDDYALVITSYEANTDADLLKGKATEHTLALEGLLFAEEDEDVLCFGTALLAKSALDDRDDELLIPARGKKDKTFAAVLPNADFPGRGGKPIMLATTELDDTELDAPAYAIENLVLEATAVLVEDREEQEVSAEVTGRFIDIGNDMEVRVTSKEVDDKGMMTIKLDLKRKRGERSAIIDSVFALNEDDDPIGGGRWTNELDLFAGAYEAEMVFPLNKERTVNKLRVVMATEYEIETVRFELEEFFRK